MNLEYSFCLNQGQLFEILEWSRFFICIEGIKTQKHSSEKERNITIKLGYANCKIFKCKECPIPDCYYSSNSKTTEMTCDCGKLCELVNHISFIDSPGHDALFSTLLSGINIMDYAVVVVSAKENVDDKPKLGDHLFVLKIQGI